MLPVGRGTKKTTLVVTAITIDCAKYRISLQVGLVLQEFDNLCHLQMVSSMLHAVTPNQLPIDPEELAANLSHGSGGKQPIYYVPGGG